MTARPCQTRSQLVLAVAAALLVALPALRAETIDWKVLTPGNTGIPGDNCYDILIDDAGRPWIPGFQPFQQQGGMARWGKATDTWTNSSNVDHPEIPSPRFSDIDKDADGTLWIATGAGLVHTAGVTWLATSGGIVHFDPGTSLFTVYGKPGTSLPSDDVDHIVATPDGSVWATSFDFIFPYPGGLTRFDGETWTTWTMTDSELPHNQAWELAARSVCGEPLATGGTADLSLVGAAPSAWPGSWLDCRPTRSRSRREPWSPCRSWWPNPWSPTPRARSSSPASSEDRAPWT